MDAVIYCRISRDRTGEEAGVTRQESDCRKLAESLGWNVAHVLVDNDISASSGKARPSWAKTLKLLESGECGGLLLWHTDRAYRKLEDLGRLVEVCRGHGVTIRTVKAGEIDLSTASGIMQAEILASVAKHETARMAERVKAQKAQAVANGQYRGGPRPFGFVAANRSLVPDPVEGPVLVEMAERLLAGESLDALARDLNDREIRTTRGGTWTSNSLRQAVSRPGNAGLLNASAFGRPGFRILGPASWEPLFPVETMERIHALLSDPARKTTVGRGRVHFLTGVLRCGVCDCPMVTRPVKRSSGQVTYYSCNSGRHTAIQKDEAELFITDVLLARLSEEPELFESSDDGEAVALRAELDTLTVRKNRLAELFAAGEIDGEQLRAGSARIGAQIESLTERLAAAGESSPVVALLGSADLAADWAAMSAARKHAVVSVLMRPTVARVGRAQRRPVWERISVDWLV